MKIATKLACLCLGFTLRTNVKDELCCVNRYYLATKAEDPGQKHLYRVSLLDRARRTSSNDCLSCGIKSESDSSYCLYNSAEFSKDNSHYVLTCAGPGIPEITIHNRVRRRRNKKKSTVLPWLRHSRFTLYIPVTSKR